jgi:hypothetical protein
MQEATLVITFTETPTKEQLELTESYKKSVELTNPEAKVLVITPRPPRTN